MSVVHRCPSCGTTAVAAGECQACHEAQVRLFCTRHTPGLWLESSTCPSCGARLGEPDREAPAPAAARAPRDRPRASAPPTPPARVDRREPREGRGHLPAPPAPRGAPSSRMRAEDPRASAIAMLGKLFRAAARARMPASAAPARSRGVAGCLLRLLLVTVILFIALASGVFFFGMALFRG